MDTPFRGRFDAKIDQKGRLLLPKGILSSFSTNKEASTENSSIVITNSQYKGFRNLDVYLSSEWSKLEEKIQRLSQLKTEVQDFRRFYLSSGQFVEPDKSHRVLIPSSLRKYAEIEAEVVIVGMGNKLEIWSLEAWNTLYDRLASNFENTLVAVANLDTDLNEGDS